MRLAPRLLLILQLAVISTGHAQSSEEGVLTSEVAEKISAVFERVLRSRVQPPHQDEPARRPVFLKPHGCAKGSFTVMPGLPDDLRVGLFAENRPTQQAYFRISSDTTPGTSDFAKNTIGFAIKVLGVPGRKILPGEENATTHDFLLQNHHVFFSDNAEEFMNFVTRAKPNPPHTERILKEMDKDVPNVLRINYWSTVPYRFGPTYAKYKLAPCATGDAPKPEEAMPATPEPNFLSKRMERDLKDGDLCYVLQVQLRTNPATMPLDKASVEWSEAESAPRDVALLSLPRQDIRKNDEKCEHMSFTAWHALPEHKPVGTVNEARGIVYKRMADIRRAHNAKPIQEPVAD